MFVFRSSFSTFISYSLGRVHIWHYQNINKDVFLLYKLKFKEKIVSDCNHLQENNNMGFIDDSFHDEPSCETM